jgi:hypothetical protein
MCALRNFGWAHAMRIVAAGSHTQTATLMNKRYSEEGLRHTVLVTLYVHTDELQ